jgi:hypothetical protein
LCWIGFDLNFGLFGYGYEYGYDEDVEDVRLFGSRYWAVVLYI